MLDIRKKGRLCMSAFQGVSVIVEKEEKGAEEARQQQVLKNAFLILWYFLLFIYR